MTGAFTDTDLDTVADLLREAGRQEIMPRFRHLGEGSIRTKNGPYDIVTDADIAAERMIATGLQDAFPGCLVVGEEAAAADPGLLDRLRAPGLSFVVDPIDGTANYAAGLPLFATMAAALIDGVVVGAVIHDPVLDESCLARRGGGAWSRSPWQARRPLRVSEPVGFRQMTGTLSWRFLPEARQSQALRGAVELAAVWDFRCAGHHYRLLADGKLHFSLYFRLLPWDHAPGWLLHREAGGYAARFNGSEYDPLDSSGGLICAPDQTGWTALRDALL